MEWTPSPLAMIVALTLAAVPSFAQQQRPDIWGKEMARQPFDERSFRQINIPEWVRETIGCGYTLSVMDGKARAAARKHGVTLRSIGLKRTSPSTSVWASASSASLRPAFRERFTRNIPTGG